MSKHLLHKCERKTAMSISVEVSLQSLNGASTELYMFNYSLKADAETLMYRPLSTSGFRFLSNHYKFEKEISENCRKQRENLNSLPGLI